MFGVRFLDPKSGEIVYPGEPGALGGAINPSSVTQVQSTGPVALNSFLVPAFAGWDLRRSHKGYLRGWSQANLDQLASPATFPPTPWLEVRSPHLPWRIEVRPKTPGVFVTVFDVVATIQVALKTEITPVEWGRFGEATKHAVLTAKGNRVRLYDFGRTLDEAYRHPRRVDTLGEGTQFAGLVPAPHRGGQSFDLHLVRRQ